MIVRLLTRALLALIAVAVLVLMLTSVRQHAPNTTRVVISEQRRFCTPDGRFFAVGHSGWIPTASCYWPPPVPPVKR